MAFLPKDKIFSRQWFIDYTLITIGSLILVTGYVFFITPHKIVPGGIYGVGIIVHYLTKGMPLFTDGFPVGMFGLIINIPLTYIGVRVLGPKFGVKTVYGFVISSLFMDGITWAREVGDAPLVDDTLLSCIFGGVLSGTGLGMIFKSKATSGGSDIIATILSRHINIPIGQTLIWVDTTIVMLALIVFSDWKIPLYSLITIFIAGRAIDMLIEGARYNKALFIISEKYEEVREKLLVDIGRGGTCLKGKGMYTNEDKNIIFTVVSRREVAIIEQYIHSIDPDAFITIMDASEILGEGFQSLKGKIENN